MVIGLPLSKFLMSLSQIILLCNWILSGDLKTKFISFFRNKAAAVLSSLFLIHFLGLLYTTDYHYAFNDIRIKIPLFILPLILSTSPPLERKTFEFILKLFIGSVAIGTIISTLILTGIYHKHVVDIREISIFISHIRFALLICISIFVCIYLLIGSVDKRYKIFYSIIGLWLFAFLVIMQSMTGIAALLVVAFVLAVYKISISKKKWLKYSAFIFILCLTCIAIYAINKELNDKIETDVVDYNRLPAYTAHGNLYKHFKTTKEFTENGHFIWIYYCESELKEEWAKRSKIDFYWKDLKGNVLRYTLVRYLTSKNLRKDADGLKQLSDEEIRLIERGVSNVRYKNFSSFRGRLHEIIWEIKRYKESGNANNQSLTQRFEYWKAATGIISDNLLFGVGTGDVQRSFDDQYIKTHSSLQKELRFHSHNQYLTITVAFGLIGLIWFLITLFYPMIRLNKMHDFLYITFFILAAISFFSEDTLETQAGVTFYAFFNSFLLFTYSFKKPEA